MHTLLTLRCVQSQYPVPDTRGMHFHLLALLFQLYPPLFNHLVPVANRVFYFLFFLTTSSLSIFSHCLLPSRSSSFESLLLFLLYIAYLVLCSIRFGCKEKRDKSFFRLSLGFQRRVSFQFHSFSCVRE